MVIEISNEIDVVRIGVDRYSLKTGCNLKTIMDISLRVLKEPRGFIRVIQCLMAILAFSTTVGFSTECEFTAACVKDDHPPFKYHFQYPFSKTVVSVPKSCVDETMVNLTLPFDFSNPAEFFVATGVLSFLYTIACLIVYIFFHQLYANNPKIPIADLGVTVILSVFWLAGSSAWAQGVVDLKYYFQPKTVFQVLSVCVKDDDRSSVECDTVEDGSYGTLNASLILGFANMVLWAASLWFVYKETVFHTPVVQDEVNQNQASKGIGKV